MPCDIGFRSIAKVTIPTPVPQEFKTRSEAPAIDADLLDKLGVEDPEFLEWVSSLDQRPLLEEALKRTLATVDAGGAEFSVTANGMLEAKGSFTSPSEKRRLSEAVSAVTNRWQFEILAIVTQLLDYTPSITQKGNTITLEAEEAGKSHPCDYIRVTRKGDDSEICFEHFKSRAALELAEAKFLALAKKLGVNITIGRREAKEGTPFPSEIIQEDGNRHSHAHRIGEE